LFVRRRVLRWIDRANTALGASTEAGGDIRPRGIRLAEETRLQELSTLERAVALAMVAIAERTQVVMLEQFDPFQDDADEDAFIAAVCSLADPETTIVLGGPLRSHPDGTTILERRIVTVDLREFSTTSDSREARR
jgi:RND superfamily putative drug exporter